MRSASLSNATSLLDDAEFAHVSDLVNRIAGIQLPERKRRMASGRIRRRLNATGEPSFGAYLERVRNDPEERGRMIDEITTNETYFFREHAHFEFLERVLVPQQRQRLRIWSAAASNGSEAYSVAILLREHLARGPLSGTKILGTDLSQSIIEEAKEGVYDADFVRKVPPPLLGKYFSQLSDGSYAVDGETKKLVTFANLNLMARWPMRGPFDVIFLRNVMIYFNRETRVWLGARMASLLSPGSFLFIGHAETLGDAPMGLKRVQPAVYVRTEEPVTVPPRPTSSEPVR